MLQIYKAQVNLCKDILQRVDGICHLAATVFHCGFSILVSLHKAANLGKQCCSVKQETDQQDRQSWIPLLTSVVLCSKLLVITGFFFV